MDERKIKVGAIQMRTMPGSSREEKVAHSLTLIERAAEEGCKIVLHGELCTADYDDFYELDRSVYEAAEPVPGPTTCAVGELAKEHGIYVIMPLFEKQMPGVYYNAAPIIDPAGEVVGVYRKTHLASAQVLERLYFRSGNGFQVWKTEFPPCAKFSSIICFDRRHPEPARILAMLDTEIMFCPTAAAGYAAGPEQWDIVNKCRSIDTGMFGVYSNRVGKEKKHTYAGQSMIVDPHGKVIARADDDEDVVVSAVLDLEDVDRARLDNPLIREMRTDLYSRYYGNPGFESQYEKRI